MFTTTADSVTVNLRHTLHCANESSWKALDSPFFLGPFDQLVSHVVPVAVVFVYEQPASTPQVIPLERLQHALALLLDHYPHLTGRLHFDPTNGVRALVRLGTGAALLEAQCSERLDVFSSTELNPLGGISVAKLPADGNALLAPFDSTVEGVCRDPLFTVQHTRFACGGVALGVRCHHILCAAEGFFQLVRDLAELYRGLSRSPGDASLSQAPCIRSYLSDFNGGKVERQAALAFQPSLLCVEEGEEAAVKAAEDGPESPSSDIDASHSPPPVVGRFMRFSGRELAALKGHATSPYGDGWVSTFDALSAHFCQRVYCARLQLHAQEARPAPSSSDYLTSVNVRPLLSPDVLHPRYFPSAIVTPYGPIPHDVLAHGALWQVARSVHDLIRGPSTTSRQEIISTQKWIAAQPDKRTIKTRLRSEYGCFMVSAWNGFDMYAGTTFDDRPVLVACPFTPISLIDGLGYFLPTEEQGLAEARDPGALDVAMALSEPLWDVLDRDEEFRRFRPV